jgi:hypothetical protein
MNYPSLERVFLEVLVAILSKKNGTEMALVFCCENWYWNFIDVQKSTMPNPVTPSIGQGENALVQATEYPLNLEGEAVFGHVE